MKWGYEKSKCEVSEMQDWFMCELKLLLGLSHEGRTLKIQQK
jgi:hypothetical protein